MGRVHQIKHAIFTDFGLVLTGVTPTRGNYYLKDKVAGLEFHSNTASERKQPALITA